MNVMNSAEIAHDLLFRRRGFDPDAAMTRLGPVLAGCDDGELFVDYRESEAIIFSDGHVTETRFSTNGGFGLRAVLGEAVGFVHSQDLSDGALARAAGSLTSVTSGHSGRLDLAPAGGAPARYIGDNPLPRLSLAEKVALLERIDAFARARDSRVCQVTVMLTADWQVVAILRPDGFRTYDVRPLVRLRVEAEARQGDRRETGAQGVGGRFTYDRVVDPEKWRDVAARAVDRALVNLESVDTPGGEMTIVLGPGKNGILLHEAVGHGLEGDGNRKGLSAFAGRLGERVSAPGTTIVDDGTIDGTRGSITIDDEGTPSQRTVLIEDGIVVGYMNDRYNARLTGMRSTGNGRRENSAFPPMPRMTNTFMLAGEHDPEEIIAAAGTGLYVADMNGGTVDFGNRFTFNVTECYLIENGKLGPPAKNCTIMGQGPTVLTGARMVGNDFILDPMGGLCGKGPQWVPVGNGQPTLLVEGLMVGGTG